MQVNECMTNHVVTVAPETSTKQAFGLMKSLGIRHLAVVKEGVVPGVVTDRDLRRPQTADVFKARGDLYRLGEEFQGEDVMSSPVVTVDANAGILTDTDLLKALIAS